MSAHSTPCPRCALCGAACDPRILAQAAHLRAAITARIRRARPEWQPADGICPACAERYADALAAERSEVSLHTTTEPRTTFPYYHPDEETVLPQSVRLPDYHTFDAAGVAIAFLDSGYFPHPDFLAARSWPNAPAWETLDDAALRRTLEQSDLRLVEYADLTNAGEQVGLHTDSLWDGANDSWHGQMTTSIAAGNGLLSDGDFRGYAPGAGIVAIKIGRSEPSGVIRIPEADILAGLEWLLADDRWARHGVRVLNVSVGGDFVQPWSENPVCRAVEELNRRGVLVAAAAGNSGTEKLLAPAQSPSVLTVGGIDDLNRRSRPHAPRAIKQLSLYSHNWGTVKGAKGRQRKPELLALARWLPAPILPVSPVFRETHDIDRLRQRLHQAMWEGDESFAAFAAHWGRTLHEEAMADGMDTDEQTVFTLEIQAALRRRMNAHKWVHRAYQHVDGTSVAVAQVSAVASQMIQANPNLTPVQVKTLLMETALPLAHLPPKLTGAGLLQPSQAVAAALRAFGGALTSYLCSGVRVPDALFTDELRNLVIHGTVSSGEAAASGDMIPFYVGLLAPSAQAVSVVGSFNGWKPDASPLVRARNGWWHGVILVARDEVRPRYRFWVEDADPTRSGWMVDPENSARAESGYRDDHTVLEWGRPENG